MTVRCDALQISDRSQLRCKSGAIKWEAENYLLKHSVQLIGGAGLYYVD